MTSCPLARSGSISSALPQSCCASSSLFCITSAQAALL